MSETKTYNNPDRLYHFDPYTCPIDELKDAIEDLNDKVGFFETQQLAIKKFINSVYGATASKYFIGFNPAIAEAITLQGQHLNHYTERSINDYFKGPFQADTELHKKLGIKTEDTLKLDIGKGKLQVLKPLTGPEWDYLGDTESIICAGDTDSTLGITKIYINNIEKTIENAFNQFKYENRDTVLKLSSGNEVVPVFNHTTKTFTLSDGVIDKPIKYIMRHKVFKAKWKIKTKSGKEVIITNDHSIMVMRNNELIKVKPCEINKKTDKIISIKKK